MKGKTFGKIEAETSKEVKAKKQLDETDVPEDIPKKDKFAVIYFPQDSRVVSFFPSKAHPVR